MSHTGMKLGAWWRGKWPEYISVSHDGEREAGMKYVPERTCRIKLSKTSVWHCDGCGQTIDGNCFADNGGRLTEYRYCPNCGARVEDE